MAKISTRLLHMSGWARGWVWFLLGITVVHVGLLHVFERQSPYVPTIHLFRPFATLGAAALLASSGFLWKQRTRRWGAWFLALSMLCSTLFSFIKITRNISTQNAAMQVLWVLVYLSAFIGAGFYLKPRWWTKSNARNILSSFTVSLVAFIVIITIYLQFQPTWFQETMTVSWLVSTSFDLGILYAITMAALRYESHNKFPIVLLFYSFICLFIADVVNTVLSWMPENSLAQGSTSPLYPLYSIHSILLAYAIYCYAVMQPSMLPERPPTIPSKEWIFWTLVPQIAVIGAFSAVSIYDLSFFPFTILLLIVAAVHIILAERDHRQVLQELAAAHIVADKAAQTNEAFIARLIHDLAPPIQGLTSVILGSRWNVDQQAEHDIAQRQLRLLEHFVHQARTYLQARTVDISCALIPLLPLCRTAISTVRLRAQQRGIRLIQEVEAEEPMVWGDEAAILRILDNLLTNALGVTPDEGMVIVRITIVVPNQIELAIIDEGPGIPVEKQAALFQPYHSIQRPSLTQSNGLEPSPTGTGMGLGLAIVRELSSAIGGRCGVRSQPGTGSTFYIHLTTGEPTDGCPKTRAAYYSGD